MEGTLKTELVLWWHLHQPYYGLSGRTRSTLPWVRLHAIKAYYDMARTLEAHPEVRAVINFSGSLLRQLREYVEEGRRDAWWDLSMKPAAALTAQDKEMLLGHFFAIDPETCIFVHARYRALWEKREEGVDRWSRQDWLDLQVWFNLAWFGFAARSERVIVGMLIDKGSGYTEVEKQAVLEQQMEVMQLLGPLYRRLHQRGQIELTVTPMYHPILPLLIDTNTAARTTPDLALPPRMRAPEDAWAQMELARQAMREYFELDVEGVWPAEGAVSPETLELLAGHEIAWTGTDEAILEHSRADLFERERDLYRPWSASGVGMLFRDRVLSDRISFEYAKLEPGEAVEDFVAYVRGVGASWEGEGTPVVTVIVDGENAWTGYRGDAEEFLQGLYGALERAEDIKTVVPGECVEGAQALERVHSGSWLMGNFELWIGHPETNRAWALMERTREDLAALEVGAQPAARERAREALYMAQSSDWFWWYGDDLQSRDDADFDRLFREQLRAVYRALGVSAPAALEEPLVEGAPSLSTFAPPRDLIHPCVDGLAEDDFEWRDAGVYRPGYGEMFDHTRFVREFYVGFDEECLYGRLELGQEGLTGRVTYRWVLSQGRERVVVFVTREAASVEIDEKVLPVDAFAYEDNIEFSVSRERLCLEPGTPVSLSVEVWEGALELERHPPRDPIALEVPSAGDHRDWLA